MLEEADLRVLQPLLDKLGLDYGRDSLPIDLPSCTQITLCAEGDGGGPFTTVEPIERATRSHFACGGASKVARTLQKPRRRR